VIRLARTENSCSKGAGSRTHLSWHLANAREAPIQPNSDQRPSANRTLATPFALNVATLISERLIRKTSQVTFGFFREYRRNETCDTIDLIRPDAARMNKG